MSRRLRLWTAPAASLALLALTLPASAQNEAPAQNPPSSVAADAQPPPEPEAPAEKDAAGDKPKSDHDPVESLKAAAVALEKSSEALAGAAENLPEKEEEEKTLVDGTVGFGARSGWNGLLLTFKEKEKKATAEISLSLMRGTLLFGTSFTAPLDAETRTAPFVDNRPRAKPFEASVSLEYNRMSSYLAAWLAESSETLTPLCERFRTEWKAANAPKPGEKRKRTPACPVSDEFRQWAGPVVGAAPTRVDGIAEKPVPLGVRWTLGIEAELGFDRQDVYANDLAADTEAKTATELEVLGILRLYPASWLAMPIRAGVSFDDTFEADAIKRCGSIPSTDATITGQNCEEELFLREDPDAATTLFAELALVAVVPGVTAALAPGIELRDRLDLAGPVRLNKLSLALFASPTAKPVLTRFGVGMEWNRALTDDEGDDPDFLEGEDWLAPFLLVGGSL